MVRSLYLPVVVDFIDEACHPTAIGVMPATSQNIRDPHQSSAVATIQIPKAIMPAEIKYAVSLPMLEFKPSENPFVPSPWLIFHGRTFSRS
jgi:hypothetical protein